jgi:alkylation response protein AidB-like acyl-CoA dehydrogenase
VETSLAKKLAIGAADYAVNEVFALVGGHGLYHDQVFSRLLNDTKVLRVAGGSLEVLRNYIAHSVLGSDDYAGLKY